MCQRMFVQGVDVWYRLLHCFQNQVFYAEDMIDIIEAVQLGTSIPYWFRTGYYVWMMLQFLLIFLVLSLAFVYYDAFHYTSPVVAVWWYVAEDRTVQLGKVQCLSFRNRNKRICPAQQFVGKAWCRKIRRFIVYRKSLRECFAWTQTPISIIRSKLTCWCRKNWINESCFRSLRPQYPDGTFESQLLLWQNREFTVPEMERSI